MMAKKVTPKNLNVVLDRIKAQVANDGKEGAKYYCEALNDMLDELLGDDFFGTEGQNDPRGDHRE